MLDHGTHVSEAGTRLQLDVVVEKRLQERQEGTGKGQATSEPSPEGNGA